MTLTVELLDSGVVGVLVGDEEGTLDGAAVWILTVSVEDILVKVDVIDVDGSTECDGDHLGDDGGFHVCRDTGSIGRAVAVRKHTLAEVTVWGTVGIGFHSWKKKWLLD